MRNLFRASAAPFSQPRRTAANRQTLTFLTPSRGTWKTPRVSVDLEYTDFFMRQGKSSVSRNSGRTSPSRRFAISSCWPGRSCFCPGTGRGSPESRQVPSLPTTKRPSQQLRPEAPTALVCWGEERKGPMPIERTLQGDAETNLSFPAIDLEPGTDRCTQVRDMTTANTMGSGRFRDAVVVGQENEELARAERTFDVQAGSERSVVVQTTSK